MTQRIRPYLSHFMAQLAASGVRDAIIAPGSRSTPLAVLLKEIPTVRITVGLDERSAAFFALGLAKGSAQPVVLVCTSGTAAANFYPAVAEARFGRVPLIILTADRPRELRDVGAPQTIDQVNLYSTHVKWFQDLPSPEPAVPFAHAAQVAARAVHWAISEPKGPVHINFPIREPLLPEPGHPAEAIMGPLFASLPTPDPQAIAVGLTWLSEAQRPVIVLGPDAPAVSGALIQRAEAVNIPILADPLNGAGRPQSTLTAYDTFLRMNAELPHPDLVIRLGAPLTSKVGNQWCSHARLILLDWPGGFRDPGHRPSLVIEGDPTQTADAIISAAGPGDESFWRQLSDAEGRAKTRLHTVVEHSQDNFEGRFFAELGALWASAKPVLAASSMPIRDVDTFWRGGTLALYANRGTNGIDGLNSTALGLSRHHGDVLAILGDLAFHHDLSGLFYARQYGLNAFIVIINNNGGAIFSYLPQAALDPDLFEELFGTPHHLDFAGVKTLYGAQYRKVDNYADFRRQFLAWRFAPGLRVLDFHTTAREESVRTHRLLYAPEGIR